MAVVTLTVLKAKYQTGDFPTEQDFIDLIDTLANDSIAVYKRYVALLTQAGTNAPVATVLENTIGNIVWSRGGAGQYYGTLNGQLPADKTFIMLNNGVATTQLITTSWNYNDSGDQIAVYVQDVNGFGQDNWLNNTAIEIRVYP